MADPITTAFAISALAAGATSAIISAISYWLKRKPSYSIRLKRGDISLSMENLDDEHRKRLIEQLLAEMDEDDSDEITVVITEGPSDG